MPRLKPIAFLLIGASLVTAGSAEAERRNNVLGTWRMVSAQIDPDGRHLPAYGPTPNSLLVFTVDMHFVEVLTDPTIPKFGNYNPDKAECDRRPIRLIRASTMRLCSRRPISRLPGLLLCASLSLSESATTLTGN